MATARTDDWGSEPGSEAADARRVEQFLELYEPTALASVHEHAQGAHLPGATKWTALVVLLTVEVVWIAGIFALLWWGFSTVLV